MNQRSTNTLEFRGVDERNLEDQLQAAREGYGSVQDMAINELAARIIGLEQRLERIEKMMGLSAFVAEREKHRTNELPNEIDEVES